MVTPARSRQGLRLTHPAWLRTVTENEPTLKFTSQEFEKE